MNESEIIAALNCPEKIGLDIGANHGGYTSSIAKKCKTVIAFEPHKGNFGILLKSVSAPNVVFYNKAVGLENGPINLYTCASNPGGHSIATEVAKQQKWDHTLERSETVDCVSLDEYFKDNTSIGFMKIDVEGAEELVLRGASHILDTNQLVIALETHQTIDCRAIYDFMTAKGYVFIENGVPVSKIECDHRYKITNDLQV